MVSLSQFRKLKCLWLVNFIDLVSWAWSFDDPVLVLDYSTLKMHTWQFDSRFSKAFNVLKENSRGANAKYGVFVIMALKI